MKKALKFLGDLPIYGLSVRQEVQIAFNLVCQATTPALKDYWRRSFNHRHQFKLEDDY
jgi:hypothetical protein